MTSRQLLERLSPEKRALLALRLRERQTSTQPASELPPLEPQPSHRFDPFPLTDLQQAYWLGRGSAFELGNLATGAYVELECVDLDTERLERAWQRLVERHDMLRVVVADDGSQCVLRDVPRYRIPLLDLAGRPKAEQPQTLGEVHRSMRDALRPPQEWPLFEIRATRLDEHHTRLHVFLDLLIVDGGSIAVLFRELARLYAEPSAELPRLDVTFRDYVLAGPAVRESEPYRRARDYWLARVPTIPRGPQLPLASSPAAIKRPWFARRQGALDVESSLRFKAQVTRRGLTASSVALAAFAHVLGAWSRSARFSINVPLFNRLPLHPQVDQIVGAFTSVNVLVADHSLRESFDARARRIHAQLMDDLNHRCFDGVEVLREVSRHAGESVTAPVVFTSLLDVGFFSAASELGTITRSINQTAQVWLDLHVDERDDQLIYKWDAVEELFPPGMMDDMAAAFGAMLHSLVDDSAWDTVGAPHVLPAGQQERRAAVNTTDAPFPDARIQDLFEARVRTSPKRPAVITSKRTLTYDELFRRANRIGRRLRAFGKRPNQIVAIVTEKGWEQAAAVYGVLHSGAAYLPVDPDFPAERIAHLLHHANVDVALTQSRVDARVTWPEDVRRFLVDRDDEWRDWDDAPLAPAQEPSDLAYVLYTSGSTGQPKGVMIEHRSVVNRVVDVNRRFEITADDRAIAVTALQHDLSVYDLFGMLSAGGALVVPDAEGRRDPAHWAALVERERVSLWNSVPAFLEMFVEYLEQSVSANRLAAQSLRTVMLSGDWIPVRLPDRIRAITPTRVISLGGPTETTVWDICYPVDTVDPEWRSIPYGRPMSNARYHVLNEALDPCPDWVTGELYIGGVGLARGYWDDDQRTGASFITHPRTGERLYRSGDVGCWLPDGNIRIEGRADFQVKIGGYRIELGEIESALQQHPALRDAVVAAIGDNGAKKRLVAYVVPRNGAIPAAQELSQFLRERLPDYMIPSSIVSLNSLPLNANGKVDRRALPKDLGLNESPKMPDAPRAESPNSGALLDELTAIVAAVLEISDLDPDADFMSYGANSIDMVRIGNQLEKRYAVRPRMDQLFRLQTVRALASYYDEHLRSATQAGIAAVDQAGSALESLVNSFRVLLDPAERDTFKESKPGIRRGDDLRPSMSLPEPAEAVSAHRYVARRSHRRFSKRPITLETLGRMLNVLRPVITDAGPKYLYASAGGLYPNQLYLHVKPERVEGLAAGTYYYHPLDHRLVLLADNAVIDRSIHVPFINTPVFDEAAFSMFFLVQLGAIAPGYGERSMHFATLEAGIMGHLLEQSAAECGLGLCHIGSVEFERIRDLFALDRGHVLVHSMLGGLPANEREKTAPLSATQERLWSSTQLVGESEYGNLPLAFELHGDFQPELLRLSLERLQRRHEILRANFAVRDGRPVQTLSPDPTLAWTELDVREVAQELRREHALDLLRREAARPLDLEHDALLRGLLLRTGAQEWLLLLLTHHILTDGWSLRVLLRELSACYIATRCGTEPQLPAVREQYSAFAAWQREWLSGEVLERQLAYWREQLRGAPAVLELPIARRGAERFSARTAKQSFSIRADVSSALRDLSRASGATLYMTLLAAFQALLHRHTGSRDVIVGTTVSTRGRRELEEMIGNLGNNLLLRAGFGDDVSFDALLGRTRDTVLSAYTHQELPLEKLVERLQLDGSIDRVPLFQTMFILRDSPLVDNLQLPGTTIQSIPIHAGASTLDLTLDITDGESEIHGTLEYKTALFEASAVDALVADYVDVLTAIARDPRIRVSALPVRTSVADSHEGIRVALIQHPAVRAAKVVRQSDATGAGRVVAHVVFAAGVAVPTNTELRNFVRSRVPGAPSPLLFAVGDELPEDNPPATAHRPVGNAGDPPTEAAAPETATEHLVIDTWRRILRLDRVGLADNFFDLGGDSLLAMHFVTRMEQQMGKRLNPGVMILQTAQQIAAELDA